MQYMRLSTIQRDELMASLANMSEYLTTVFAGLSPEQVRAPGSDGGFSPVEQVWHLADLEREGFGVRIQRLLSESKPVLPDFDGTTIASERDYRSLSLQEGLRVFRDARRKNIAAFPPAESELWFRSGIQENIGNVSLCDMPSFMSQHDAAHKAEIEAWKSAVAR